MRTKLITAVLLIFTWTTSFSQGHIDHIKNQEYLKSKNEVDCNNPLNENTSDLDRVCANLAFQKSDSLLTVVYDSLLLKAKTHHIDSLEYKIIQMQTTWRSFRDQHCAIIYDKYEGCGGCHLRAINYLYCLKELTENRIKELKMLSDNLTY
ncbi:MAG: lysozyme inhibitor LprI family protein [Daejeonella sp.]